MPEQQQSSPLISGDTIAGGIMNIAGTTLNNIFARQRESDARAENYEYNEKAAENAYQRQLNYYDTRMSPAALLAQYREAGLSPSLMFGGGGVGGGTATAPQGQGSSGVSPNVFGMNLLESAQVGLMQAQTRKLNAEADTEQGLNERGSAEINNIVETTAKTVQEAGYYESAAKLTEMDTELKKLQKIITESTVEDQITQIRETSKKITQDALSAVYSAKITKIDLEILEKKKDGLLKEAKNYWNIIKGDLKLKNAEYNKILSEKYLNEELAWRNCMEGFKAIAEKNASWASVLDTYDKMNREWYKIAQTDESLDQHFTDQLLENRRITTEAITKLLMTAMTVLGASKVAEIKASKKPLNKTKSEEVSKNAKGKTTRTKTIYNTYE